MQDYTRLNVWQRAHALTLAVYKATERFPSIERYGLTAQLRRAVASIPTNVAEGSARRSDPVFNNFLDVARGSASEVGYQLLLARDLGYLPASTYEALSAECVEIARMLMGLRRRLFLPHRVTRTARPHATPETS